jgi:hypothetical protein
MSSVRKSQRAPLSCTNCARRRVKCDKKIPCGTCTSRKEDHICRREPVIVNGVLKNTSSYSDHDIETLREENITLLQRIKDLESRAEMSHNRHIPTDAQAYLNSNKFTIYNLAWDSGIMNTLPEELRTPELKYEQTTAIVQFSLEYLSFIHCAIRSPDFYTQYHRHGIQECFSRGDYLDSCIWYGLLCSGIYFADYERLQSWGIDSALANEYPEIYMRASLECMHRAEYMKYPGIRTVQAFCVLSLCFNQLNSRYLQDCLSLTAIYICQTLGLDNIDGREMGQKVQFHWTRKFVPGFGGP